jgi:hypothetical protein
VKQPQAPKPQPVNQEQAKRIDAAMLEFKQRDGYAQRQFAQALRLEQAMPQSLRGVL